MHGRDGVGAAAGVARGLGTELQHRCQRRQQHGRAGHRGHQASLALRQRLAAALGGGLMHSASSPWAMALPE
jgi:hypothetical protein